MKISVFDQRFYQTEDNQFIPSTTTIINAPLRNAGLEKWYKKVGFKADEITAESLMRGSLIHSYIERILKEEELDLAELGAENFLVVQRWVNFFKKINCGEIFIENNFVYITPEIEFAGTIDLLAYIKEGTYIYNRKEVKLESGWYIFDWKTGGKYTERHNMQLAAYSYAIEQLKGIEIKGAMDVYLEAETKSGLSVSFLSKEDMTTWYETFKKVYAVYDALYKVPKPTLIDIATTKLSLKNE